MTVNPIRLLPGDIVCTTYCVDQDGDGPDWLQLILSLGIRWGQKFNDVDGQAYYTHTFVITSHRGETFEALWRYRTQQFFAAYAGRPVLIGRHRGMTMARFCAAHSRLLVQYGGRRYPSWKIPLFFLAPRLLKYLPGKPVCSELSLQNWYLAGVVDHWKGASPSYVADMIRHWRDIQIVYEDIAPKKQEV